MPSTKPPATYPRHPVPPPLEYLGYLGLETVHLRAQGSVRQNFRELPTVALTSFHVSACILPRFYWQHRVPLKGKPGFVYTSDALVERPLLPRAALFICMYMSVCICVCGMYMCNYICVYVCVYICMWVYLHALCMFTYVYICVYVCLYLSMCVYIFVRVYIMCASVFECVSLLDESPEGAWGTES